MRKPKQEIYEAQWHKQNFQSFYSQIKGRKWMKWVSYVHFDMRKIQTWGALYYLSIQSGELGARKMYDEEYDDTKDSGYSTCSQGAYHVIPDLISNFRKHVSFWSHALVTSRGGQEQHTKEDEEWHTPSKESLSMPCYLTCREPQWHRDQGSHGLWWLK